jgi:hypothetical protein
VVDVSALVLAVAVHDEPPLRAENVEPFADLALSVGSFEPFERDVG